MRVSIFVAALIAVALAAPLRVVADDDDTVEYRRHIMASLGEQMDALAMIVQHRAPADNFAVHAQTLAVIAATGKKAFEPKVPGGNSKPEVWSQWADFSKRLDALVASTGDLAKTGGVAAAGAKVDAASMCKSCHDTYMVPKK
jgi:cytochrome c556